MLYVKAPRLCVAVLAVELPMTGTGGQLLGLVKQEHLCGCTATQERTVEGIVCPLCQEHAAEYDAETTSN